MFARAVVLQGCAAALSCKLWLPGRGPPGPRLALSSATEEVLQHVDLRS